MTINQPALENIQGYIWLDGQFVEWHDAKIHVLTHSLHYGGSVFEGEKSFNGKIFKVKEHTQRLLQSAKCMKLHIPYSVDEIISSSHELLKKNNLLNAYVRPMAWRSTDALMVRLQNPVTHLMIAAWEPRRKVSESAHNLVVSKWRKPSDDAFPVQCKSSSQYAMFAVCVQEAVDSGYDDALLLDKNGFVAECTTSNIFFVKGNSLVTPKTSFCLNGITRQTVIGLALRMGLEVTEKDMLPDEMTNFEDCFITGTASGLKSIGSITYEGKKSNYEASEIFNSLKSKYQNLVTEAT